MSAKFGELDAMKASAEKWAERLESELQDAVEEATLHGEDVMQGILQAAATKTGQERAAAGGNGPGRVNMGDMSKAVMTNIKVGRNNGTVGEFGWVQGAEDYFLYQEHGNDSEEHAFNVKFKGMHALHGAFIQTREKFRARLQDLGLKVH